MDRPFIFNTLVTGVFILMLPTLVRASSPIKMETTIINSSFMRDFSFLDDTVGQQFQDDKKDKSKEKPDPKQIPDKPVIREVPKARKQTRPPVVVKPNIKVKPIKIIRPNIKRP